MKRYGIAWMVLTLAFGLAGCRNARLLMPEALPPTLSPEQRQEMQVKIWDASADVVFGATLAMLQDLGWTLDSVDKASGLIRVSTGKRLEAFGPEDEQYYDADFRRKTAKRHADVAKKWTRWKEAIIHIESWNGNRTRQRLVLNLRGMLPSMSYLERQDGDGFSRGRDVMINAPAVEQSVEIAMPEAYVDMFDRISVGVLQRVFKPE